jgi:hypothetical protein
MTAQMPVTNRAFFVAVPIPGIHAPVTAVVLLVAFKLPSWRCHELPWMAGLASMERRARNLVLQRYVSPSGLCDQRPVRVVRQSNLAAEQQARRANNYRNRDSHGYSIPRK